MDVITRNISFRSYEERHACVTGIRDIREFVLYLESLERGGARIVSGVYVSGSADDAAQRMLRRYSILSLMHSIEQGCASDAANASIVAVSGDIRVEHIQSEDGHALGTCVEAGGYLHLSLAGLSEGTALAGEVSFSDEIAEEYVRNGRWLHGYGFSSEHVCRYWNYMADIASHYADFNRARDGYFVAQGVKAYPAATGIEAVFPGERRISIGLEAYRPIADGSVIIAPVVSDMQCEASMYGPKFSRATSVVFPKDGIEKLYVSGTSNIGKTGQSTKGQDVHSDISYTMSCIGHLLSKRGMSLEDIVSARAYFHDAAAYQAFLSLYLSEGWTFPYIPVFSSVCRKELVFEMECLAAHPFGT